MSKDNIEFINVPVPVQHVTAVYELIARLAAGGGPDRTEVSVSPEKGKAPTLSEGLVSRMYGESEPAHRRFLEYLAEHPDQWLDSQSVADGLGLEHGRKSLAGSLGAFGRRAEHRYGGLKPFESHWDPGSYLVKLRMSQEVATWVKAAAAS